LSNFQVLFSGELVGYAEQSATQTALARELGIDERKSRQLFNGKTVVLASQLSQQAAQTLQEKLHDLGAMCRIKDLAPKTALPLDYEAQRSDHTLADLTAAHVECPRCAHMQLESSHCARCGVNMEELFKQRRKEDLLIEKKLRDLRAAKKKARKSGQAAVSGVAESLQLEGFLPRDEVLAAHQAASKFGKLKRFFSRS